jgi:hypothetical protein
VSKTIDHVLLVPGESGWEIWSGQGGAGFSLVTATEHHLAGELDDIPPGEITMLFPVRAITAVPMRVASDDDALFPDLVTLHAERLGLRPDPMAGQLTDVFVVARENENTALLSVFLRSPGDGELPPKGPKSFDISARSFPATGDVATIWREFGRWVFAIFHQGKLVYCQATAIDSTQPDVALAREIKLALIQLGIQGLEVQPSRAVVWSSRDDLDSTSLREILRIPVDIATRPAPVPHSPLSKLLPADVRAARREALRRRNLTIGIAAVVAAYLGLIGWLGFGLWKDMSETKKLVAAANAAAPDAAAFELHLAKWDELSHAIDLTHSPVDILNRIATSIPPNSGLRLKEADISATSIKLRGEAQQFQATTTFSLRLTKNNELAHFTWEVPEANQSTRGWDFVYTAEIPVADGQQ